MAGREGFESQWPEVEAKVRRVLAARGVPVDEREDVVQEVAARALASDIAFPSTDRFAAWASTVARRLHIESLRRNKRLQSRLHTMVDPYGGGDCAGSGAQARSVEAVIEARLDVAVATKFVAALSADERHALLGDTGGARQTSAFYVQRHRLRRKLQRAIEGVGALWANLGRRFVLRGMRLPTGDGAAPVTHATFVLAPVAAACALVLGQVLGSHDPASVASRKPPAVAATAAAPSPGATSVPASSTAAAAAHRDGPGRDTPSPTGRAPQHASRWPEATVEAGPPGQEVAVEVESRTGPQPLWCVWGVPVVPDTCVGEAPNVDLPTR